MSAPVCQFPDTVTRERLAAVRAALAALDAHLRAQGGAGLAPCDYATETDALWDASWWKVTGTLPSLMVEATLALSGLEMLFEPESGPLDGGPF